MYRSLARIDEGHEALFAVSAEHQQDHRPGNVPLGSEREVSPAYGFGLFIRFYDGAGVEQCFLVDRGLAVRLYHLLFKVFVVLEVEAVAAQLLRIQNTGAVELAVLELVGDIRDLIPAAASVAECIFGLVARRVRLGLLYLGFRHPPSGPPEIEFLFGLRLRPGARRWFGRH